MCLHYICTQAFSSLVYLFHCDPIIFEACFWQYTVVVDSGKDHTWSGVGMLVTLPVWFLTGSIMADEKKLEGFLRSGVKYGPIRRGLHIHQRWMKCGREPVGQTIDLQNSTVLQEHWQRKEVEKCNCNPAKVLPNCFIYR